VPYEASEGANYTDAGHVCECQASITGFLHATSPEYVGYELHRRRVSSLSGGWPYVDNGGRKLSDDVKMTMRM